MKTNLQKAQDFAIEQCLSDYPPRATYAQILDLVESGSRRVSVWEPLEYCDVVHIMENMVSAVTRLLDEQEVPA
jgi:hypothetical protein